MNPSLADQHSGEGLNDHHDQGVCIVDEPPPPPPPPSTYQSKTPPARLRINMTSIALDVHYVHTSPMIRSSKRNNIHHHPGIGNSSGNSKTNLLRRRKSTGTLQYHPRSRRPPTAKKADDNGRHVCFDDSTTTTDAATPHYITPDEEKIVWYSAKELKDLGKRDRKLIQQAKQQFKATQGDAAIVTSHDDDDDDHKHRNGTSKNTPCMRLRDHADLCLRGLETSLSRRAALEQRARRVASIQAVLAVQHESDPALIRRRSLQASKKARQLAHQLGLHDQQQVGPETTASTTTTTTSTTTMNSTKGNNKPRDKELRRSSSCGKNMDESPRSRRRRLDQVQIDRNTRTIVL